MSAPLIGVDFVKPRSRLTLAGGVLLILGVGAAVAASLEYRAIESQRAGLELKLREVNRTSQRDPTESARIARLSKEAGGIALELGAPWTKLLSELEGASRDSTGQIALLSVEPDLVKHNIRITGESHDLPMVLAYVDRLQTSALLRYPMLDTHEVKADDPQHPVRFALTAEWREAQ
jgi:hypothetical protein